MHEWQSMASAPRDGAIIEIKNSYGLLPTYGLFRWESSSAFPGQGWRSALPDRGGLMDGSENQLRWRPYSGDPSAYVDYSPSMDEWRRAMSR